MIVSMIVAMGQNRVIGKHNQMMWQLPNEQEHYLAMIRGRCLIIGRKNYESRPDRFRAHKAVVVTAQKDYQAAHPIAHSIEAALAYARSQNESEVFVIGGAQIYALALPYTQRLYLSIVDFDQKGDTYFPPHEHYDWEELKREYHPVKPGNPIAWSFTLLEKNPKTV